MIVTSATTALDSQVTLILIHCIAPVEILSSDTDKDTCSSRGPGLGLGVGVEVGVGIGGVGVGVGMGVDGGGLLASYIP